MANPRRRTRALRYFGAGGWPVGLPETIFRATAKASATASLALASVVFALGGGPTGFPKQVSERCKAGGSWTPTAMANPRRRARSVILALGAGPSGFPKQSSGRSFRDSHGKPAPSLAHAPLFWRWGLARRASRNKFPSDAKRGDLGGRRGICGPKPMSQHGRGPGQWPRWPFYQPEADKWPDL